MKEKIAKPFLKWAGGKSQLLEDIHTLLPKNIVDKDITYVEPFVGSGAVLFWILERFPNIQKAIINDSNKDLINCYNIIKKEPLSLIGILKKFEEEYHQIDDSSDSKRHYYNTKRYEYNLRNADDVRHGALFIFLNKTCFNGLYRVNKKNEFNVPIGSYKKPLICDEANIYSVSKTLQKVEILNCDYAQVEKSVTGSAFFYFDPPYKPLSKTSNFNSYGKEEFNDEEQIRLRDFCSKLDNEGYQWMLSNSDVKGNDPENDFFDVLYSDYNITRVFAKRSINSKGASRGKLSELLITNYNYEEALSIA